MSINVIQSKPAGGIESSNIFEVLFRSPINGHLILYLVINMFKEYLILIDINPLTFKIFKLIMIQKVEYTFCP